MSIYIPQIIEMVVTIIFGIIGIAVKNIYARYVNTDTKRAVAKTVVLATEQIYKDLHGKDKFGKALQMLSEQLADEGIHITAAEMQLLIEAAVAEFNRKSREG